jgi:hypothetical protein
MDIKFESLLPLLVASNVRSFRLDGLHITFKNDPKPKGVTTFGPPVTNDAPPDFRGNDDMSYDKIVNWSAPGGDEPMPLAGDRPLDEVI